MCNLFDTPQLYSFADRVFRSDCNTKEVYEEGAKAVALSVVSGINCESTPASYLTPIFFWIKVFHEVTEMCFLPLFICLLQQVFLHMVKQVVEKHTPWLEKQNTEKSIFF